MARCLNCIHCDVCDTDRYYKERVYGDCSDFFNDANIVEVVRCKDCKYYEIHKPNVTLNCERDGKLIAMMPNDFCSYGERKEK